MTKLDDWEHKLSGQMATIELIGELDLTSEEIQEIGQLIASLTHSQGAKPALGHLKRRYPATLAAFLVFQGGSSYHSNDKGDFWPGVCEAAGIPYNPNYTLALGQYFEQILQRFGLRHDFAGQRYVGEILGHGGIPPRSLPDFFEHMLQPSITRPELAALSTPDLISEWLHSSAQYQVNKPILRFLEYGSKVAENFVDRCRHMAGDYADQGELASAFELGLSEALIDAYREWIDQPSHRPQQSSSSLRLRRPSIVLDPWGVGVTVVLPEQPIPAIHSLTEMWWEIVAGRTVQKIEVIARRVDMDLKTRAAVAALPSPEQEYHVRLFRRMAQADNEMLREWTFDGFDSALPLMAFDPQTNNLMVRPRRLPACHLWVVHPIGVQIESNPSGQRLIAEEAQKLPFNWYSWRCCRLDLQNVSALRLVSKNNVHSIPVIEKQSGLAAELVNGVPLSNLDDPVPIFIGTPPTLRIVTDGLDLSADRLERWRLELAYEWNADPERTIKCRLNEIQDLVRRKDGAIEIPLAHARLLGRAPVGQYRVRVQERLGCSADFRFRITPNLHLTGHETLYLPEPGKDAPTVRLQIKTDSKSRLEFLQAEPEFHLKELPCPDHARCYQVTVPPDRADAPLRLVRDIGTGRAAYFPLRIPIRRLRWLLIRSLGDLAKPAWQSTVAPVNLDELEQSDAPCLLVELPVSEECRVVTRLCFRNENGALIAELEASGSTGSTGIRRFDLRSARDALRKSQSPAIQVVLNIEGLAEHNPLSLTIMTLRRTIFIKQVTLALRQTDDGQFLDIGWYPDIPLRHRRIHLWRQTQSWVEPLTLAIPDAAHRSHSFPVPAGAIPIGVYLVEFLVLDPWLAAAAPVRPKTAASNVHTVVVGRLEERLAELRRGVSAGNTPFSIACESALLWKYLGKIEHAAASLQECWQSRNTATLQQMLTLAREFRDHPNGKALGFTLYQADQVARIIARYHADGFPKSLIDEYLAEMPALTNLALKAVGALLEAPDERVQLAAARHLIEKNENAGIKAAFEWETSGRLSRKDLDDLLMLNLPLSLQFMTSQFSPEESIRFLRMSDNRDFQLAAATSLVARGDPQGLPTVVSLFEHGLLSAAQAVQSLGANPRSAAQWLAAQTSGDGAALLLERLLNAHPDAVPFIRPGIWVHCQHGWAQIVRMEAPNGQQLPSVAPEEFKKSELRLYVIFDPGQDAIEALMIPSLKQMRLPNLNAVYQCTKCHQFIATNPYKIINDHNRKAHGGLGPSYNTLSSTLPLFGPLEFRYHPPELEW